MSLRVYVSCARTCVIVCVLVCVCVCVRTADAALLRLAASLGLGFTRPY